MISQSEIEDGSANQSIYFFVIMAIFFLIVFIVIKYSGRNRIAQMSTPQTTVVSFESV